MIKRILTLATDRIHTMPVLVLMPHSRCNCRCVMCDIWKANSEKREISTEELEKHVESFKRLGVKRVALSGGEALLHSNIWRFCELLQKIGAKISLLSTGITLKNHAAMIIKHCDDVIVSLDGSPAVHNQIRNIPHAFERLAEGVRELKLLSPTFRVTGRCVIQKYNFRDFDNIIETAVDLGLDQISFLPADVSSTAYNRETPWDVSHIESVALDEQEANQLRGIFENSFTKFNDLYTRRVIAEDPKKIAEIARYYKAVLRLGEFPPVNCNAPWVSAVIEPNGDVLPCFFHKSYGNIFENSLTEIVNSPKAIQFRKNLDMNTNETCKRCVCSLYLPAHKTA